MAKRRGLINYDRVRVSARAHRSVNATMSTKTCRDEDDDEDDDGTGVFPHDVL